MGDDKKTFSDLFSNSMSNDEEKDKLEPKNSSVTFDHIFNDNIFENNENKESTEDINFDLEEKSLEKNNDNLENKVESISDNLFFQSDKDNLKNHVSKKEEKLEDAGDFEKNSLEESNNLFFQGNDSQLKASNSDELENGVVSIPKKIENNVFFQSVKPDLNKSLFDKNTDADNALYSLNEARVSENIFNCSVPEKKEEVKLGNTDSLESSVDKEVFSQQEVGNVFFDSSIDNHISSPEDEKHEEKKIVSPSDSENDIKKSEECISPFFSNEGENLEQLNFGLDKISLVENDNKVKRVNKLEVDKLKHYDVKIVKKKEPLFKFILGVISYAIFIWLLLIGIALLVYVLDIKIRASKGDYSSPTFNAYVVLTGSMLPEIQVNDVVVTKKVEAESLKVGDVITFASADSRFLNTIITHRIIKKEYDSKTKTYSFQTQGDNNNVADSALVPQNNIFGKVILKIPKLGYLQEFLASDGGWIIVILIPCLTVISYDIVRLVKGLKRKKYKNITVQK